MVVPTSVPQTCPGAAAHRGPALWGTTHPWLLEWGLVDGAMKCDRQDPKPQKETGETKWTIISRAVLLPDGNAG